MVLHVDKVHMQDKFAALTSFQAHQLLKREKAPQTIPNHAPVSFRSLDIKRFLHVNKHPLP